MKPPFNVKPKKGVNIPQFEHKKMKRKQTNPDAETEQSHAKKAKLSTENSTSTSDEKRIMNKLSRKKRQKEHKKIKLELGPDGIIEHVKELKHEEEMEAAGETPTSVGTTEEIERRIMNKLKRRQKYKERKKQMKRGNKALPEKDSNQAVQAQTPTKQVKSRNKYKHLASPKIEKEVTVESTSPEPESDVNKEHPQPEIKSDSDKSNLDQAEDLIPTEASVPSTPKSQKKNKSHAESNDSPISDPIISVKKTKKDKKKQPATNESTESKPVVKPVVKPAVNSKFDINKLKHAMDTHKATPSKTEVKSDSSDEEEEVEDSKSSKQPKPVLSLGERMKEKLCAARFRHLNEQLYVSSGDAAYKLMQDDPDGFTVYHQGFQKQVEKWPENPLDRVMKYVRMKRADMVVADFGCGDAQLACSVPNKVHSFDLVAVNERVTACNMAKLPLTSGSVDIGVFCLSLMGTNLNDFIWESNRVIKMNGTLLVAEVVSRFDKVNSFVSKMEKLGFTIINKDTSNKMFVWFEFRKISCPVKSNSLPVITLEPCIYKRR